MPPNEWLDYVNAKRKADVLRVLESLSGVLDPQCPQFVLIGALSLLLRRKLFRRSLWDVDLLFRDEKTLRSFMDRERSIGARIVHYDEELVVNKGISSLHTAWSFEKAWVNVDYILREPYFEFYLGGRTGEQLFEERVQDDGRVFEIRLLVAHPWDVLIDKMLSPRFGKELSNRDFMGVDVRHVFLILRLDGENPELWGYIRQRIRGTPFVGPFREKLGEVLRAAPEIAREGIGAAAKAKDFLNELETLDPEG